MIWGIGTSAAASPGPRLSAPVTLCALEPGTLACHDILDGEDIGLKPGSTLFDVVDPADADLLRDTLAETTEQAAVDLDLRHVDGRWLRLRARRADATFQAALFDVTDRIRSDEIASIEARMLRAFSRAASFADALQPFIETLARLLDLRAAELWLTDHRSGSLRRVAVTSRGLPPFHLERVTGPDTDKIDELPSLVAHAGTLLWIENVRDEPRFGRRKEALEDGIESLVAQPIAFNNRDLGALLLFGNGPLPEDAAVVALLQRLGAQLSLLVTNLRRGELLQRSQRRLRFLADLSRALARASTPETVSQAAADVLVPAIGDLVVIERTSGGSRHPTIATAGESVPKVLAGAPLLAKGIDGRQAIPKGDPLELAGGRHAVAVPLEGRTKMLGRLLLVSIDEPFDQDEELLTREAARRIVAALEHAEAFAQRSHIAMTLQRSLLPPSLPEIPGIDVAAYYRAAGDGVDSGGDFYDLFPTGGASWTACVGDVQGKGSEAAAVTALARYTLRAAAVRARRPSKILDVLNTTLITNDQTDRCCTVALARIERSGHDASITLCLGGHPPSILRSADGRTRLVGRPGRLLGALDRSHLADDPMGFGPGDVFVMYTDGITESRNRKNEPFGEERLLDLIATMPDDLTATAIADTIARAAMSWQDGEQSDDIAILVLRSRDPVAEARRAGKPLGTKNQA